MIEYKAQENAYLDLDGIGNDTLNDLLELGVQIKDRLGLKSSPIQYVSGTRVYIGGVIGNVSLNDTRLIIAPKVPSEGGSKVGMIKRLLERTIKCSIGNINSTIYYAKSSVISSDEIFTDVLASVFLSSLTSALRSGKIMGYEEIMEKSRVIKGRVLIRKQLSQPVADEKTWCRFNRMSDNNPYNQLLYWACRYLSESAGSFDLKRRLLLLSREFAQRTDMLSVYAVKTLRPTRQFSEYMEALSIAQNLYLGAGGKQEVGKAGSQLCGYVINMERAFENIVCAYSNRAASSLGFSHQGQASIRFAAANGTCDQDYDIRPDDLVFDGARRLVMDAKYKVLTTENKYKRKPSREDFYQMISACIAYNCPEAILVYPLSAKFPARSWDTIQMVNGRRLTIKCVGVDIFGCDSDIEGAISQAIQASYLYKEKAI